MRSRPNWFSSGSWALTSHQAPAGTHFAGVLGDVRGDVGGGGGDGKVCADRRRKGARGARAGDQGRRLSGGHQGDGGGGRALRDLLLLDG